MRRNDWPLLTARYRLNLVRFGTCVFGFREGRGREDDTEEAWLPGVVFRKEFDHARKKKGAKKRRTEALIGRVIKGAELVWYLTVVESAHPSPGYS